ncbi:hypothetical protein CASFOL_009416 [Castilleja foliolosa]|uniref:Uncharacterized protein n=1 Tax=Castilleja foliolosa TaxID=1961234 RepID=A0ABD3DXV2_9LAMI
MDAATNEINASSSACETTVLQSANTSSSSSPPSSIASAADDSFPTSVHQSPPTIAEDVSDHASELLYSLVTGLKFGHTDFDLNEDYSYPSNGVYKRKICRGRGGIKLNDLVERFAEGEFAVSTDDQLKISKDEDKWENFSWGSYTFQILYSKIQQVPLTRSPESKQFAYHFYGFCHAFAHWIFEAVPPLASLLMSKNRRPDPQRPRLLKWPLPAEKKSLDNFFKDEVHKECLETLEPTIEELIDYPWWSHVADDVRSHVQYVQRAPEHSLRQRKRARSDSEKVTQLVKEFMLRMRWDFITAVEKMRQESANNLEKAKQDIADMVKDVRQRNAYYIQEWKHETAEIKDGFKQELTVIGDNIVERITQNNAVSMEQANSEIKACMEQLRHNVMVRFQQMVPEPSNCNPMFDSAPDLPFVPFEDSFDEQLDAYTDPCDNKEAYVLSRGGNEALMTPIKIPLPATKELTPIRVDSDQLNSLLDPVVRFARPLRPTVEFKGSTFGMNKKQSKEMDAYRSFMASDSDELRNIGNTLHANRLFFRHIENTETAMDKLWTHT